MSPQGGQSRLGVFVLILALLKQPLDFRLAGGSERGPTAVPAPFRLVWPPLPPRWKGDQLGAPHEGERLLALILFSGLPNSKGVSALTAEPEH